MASEKDDPVEVEFHAHKSEDGKYYELKVICQEGLRDDEYADCLVAFAKDINDGEFKFDNDSGDPAILTQ